MLDLVTFDFEEQAVRVIQRDGEPWFVAADVCRVLDIANRHDAVSRLDDDERDAVGNTDTVGREQRMTIISESGLYALIFTSRKEAAKRFRKWVTGEVLPTLRRTGRYEMPNAPAPESSLGDLAREEVGAWLTMVREARLLRGRSAAVALWNASPLPPLPGDPAESAVLQDAALVRFLTEACEVTGDPTERVSARDLIEAFQVWSVQQMLARRSDRAVALQLSSLSRLWLHPKSGRQFVRMKSNGAVMYCGIRLSEGMKKLLDEMSLS